MQEFIAVAFGGGIGAYLRHKMSVYTKTHFQVTCKNTFLLNIIGCLCFGVILALVNIIPNVVNQNVKLFLTTGIIASFTTFSTFAYENVILLKDREFFKSFLYTTMSLVLGISATYLGYMVILKLFQ